MHQYTGQRFSSCQCTWWEKPLCTNHDSVTFFGIALTVECTVICARYSLCVISLKGQGSVYITCMVDNIHAPPKFKAIQAMTHAYLCIIHFFCFVNICKEILCIHVAVCVEKHPVWTMHVKSWVCMTFQLTRHVSNALRRLSSVGIHGQVWASLSLPEWLTGGFTFCSCTAACSFRCSHLAQFCQRAACELVRWLVIEHELTGEVHSSPYAAPLYFICEVHIPPRVMHPWDFGPSCQSEVSFEGLAGSVPQAVLLLSKFFHVGLSKAWFLLRSAIYWTYQDKISLWGQICQKLTLITKSKHIAALSYLNFGL